MEMGVAAWRNGHGLLIRESGEEIVPLELQRESSDACPIPLKGFPAE